MNALVPTNIQLPAHLSSRVGTQSSVANSLTAGLNSGGGFKRISIRGSRFRIREGNNETVLPDAKLRAVIVGASPNITKTYFKGTFNPKAEDKGPDCYSNDGIRPAADADDPQSQLCASCQHNAWGSKMSESGQRMKACADQKRLAVISADDHSPEPEVYLFQVTPGALNDFRAYGKLLESKGLPPEIVVTEISFDPKEAYPKAVFKFGGFIDEAMVPVVDELVGSSLVREITGEQPLVATVLETPVGKTKPSPVRETTPEPEVIEAEVEVIEAPKKTKGFGGTPITSTPVPSPKEPTVVTSSNLANDINDILKGMEEDDE